MHNDVVNWVFYILIEKAVGNDNIVSYSTKTIPDIFGRVSSNGLRNYSL